MNAETARWLWTEAVNVPLIVLNLNERQIVTLNSEASALLGRSGTELEGKPSSLLLPDYLLPPPEVVSQWVEEAAGGQSAGLSIDILVESPGATPVRLGAHIGPLDGSGGHVLLTLEEPDDVGKSGTGQADDILLGLMSDIGRIVGSSLDLEAVSQRFAIALMHVVPAEHVAIHLVADEGESLQLIFSTGHGVFGPSIQPTDHGPVSRAIQSGTAVLINEQEIEGIRKTGTAAAWPDEIGTGVLTACCVPLIASGECIGVALLASALGSAFTPEDLELLEHASSQVAGAISNLMLHEQLAEGALERDVLANIARLGSAVTDFAGAMPGIASEVKRFMPISELCVYEPDDVSGELARAYIWTDSGREADLDAESLDEASADRETIFGGASTVVSTVRLANVDLTSASVTSPLRFGGEVIGTLTAISAGDETYAVREATFTSLVASQIAGAVHTARVYRNQQRESNLRRSLAQISLAASRDLAPNSVFERIANEVAELIEYDLFAIALQTPDRSGLNVRFHIGNDEVLKLYQESGPAATTDMAEWRETVIRTASRSARFSNLARQGINSLIEVSLGTKESGATGYLLVGASDVTAFTERELQMLAQVAAQVTPAIQNATAHEQAVALAEARMSEARAEARSLELEKINDAKSRFLSIVSHELRTPLTSIIAYAELLERNVGKNMSEKQIKQAAIINKSAMHLRFLISDLLDVSRIESGNLSLDMSTFELGETVRDVVDQFEPVLAEKDQRFDAHIASESIRLYADRSRIMQVVSNLVENASKYSAANTVVTVSVHRSGNEVLITVADEGIGISEDDLRQLFVPFFRANSELTRTEPGTGLGLALVKNIAELHGGHVSVESAPGKGSTFSVALRATSREQAA